MVSGRCEADCSWAVDAAGRLAARAVRASSNAPLQRCCKALTSPSSWVIVPLEVASFNKVPVHRKLAPSAVKITRVAS
jgi:hypothetical protein